MAFYDLSKTERARLVATIGNDVLTGLKTGQLKKITACFGDEDTYVRKSAYILVGKFFLSDKSLQQIIIHA